MLQEFYVQATRVTKPDRLAHEAAVNLVESWLRQALQGGVHFAGVTVRNPFA